MTRLPKSCSEKWSDAFVPSRMSRENRSGRGSIRDAPRDLSSSLLFQAECRTGTRPTPSCGANRLLASGRPPPRSTHAAPAGPRHSSVARDPDRLALAFRPLPGSLSVGRSYRSLRSHRAPGSGIPSVGRTRPLSQTPHFREPSVQPIWTGPEAARFRWLCQGFGGPICRAFHDRGAPGGIRTRLFARGPETWDKRPWKPFLGSEL